MTEACHGFWNHSLLLANHLPESDLKLSIPETLIFVAAILALLATLLAAAFRRSDTTPPWPRLSAFLLLRNPGKFVRQPMGTVCKVLTIGSFSLVGLAVVWAAISAAVT